MCPQKIALLTDSCADLSPALAAENHIHIVPLRILCADGEYSDGMDIRGADIYKRLWAGELPQTSLPAGEDIEKVLRQIVMEGYDGVIAIMLSGGLSGTYNLVRLIAEECKGLLPVRVYDSVSGSLGMGLTVLQIAEGWTADVDPEIHDILNKRTDPTWPTTWFVPRLCDKPAFKDVYSVMNNWGANHGAISYGHIGADLITLASMLRIPVCMHNVEDDKIFRPAAWNAFGMDKEGADYRACANFGPMYK